MISDVSNYKSHSGKSTREITEWLGPCWEWAAASLSSSFPSTFSTRFPLEVLFVVFWKWSSISSIPFRFNFGFLFSRLWNLPSTYLFLGFFLSSNVCISVLYFRATATFEFIFYLLHPLLASIFLFVLTGPRPNLNLYCFILYWFQYCLNFVIYAARSEQYRWQSSMFWKCLTVGKSWQLLGVCILCAI